MSNQTAARLLVIIGVVANVGAIVEYGGDQPWLFALLPVIVALSIILPNRRRLFGYIRLRRVLTAAEELLANRGIRPDLFIAFDRSSTIVAGMLAQRLGISEVLSLPRTVTTSGRGKRKVEVGRGIQVSVEGDAARDLSRAVIIVFHLRTGGTLEAGLAAVGDDRFPGEILALYATVGALAHWPNVLHVATVEPGDPPNDHFPWIKGQYLHS